MARCLCSLLAAAVLLEWSYPLGAQERPQVRFNPGQSVPVSIVFVCDVDGMKADVLRQELLKAVSALKPNQSFTILFARPDTVQALSAKLLPATPENRKKAAEFLDRIEAGGTPDPALALRDALALEPKLIFFLSDGDLPDNKAALELVRRHNARKKTVINTVAFMERGEYEKTLQQIAIENGGRFKFYEPEDAKNAVTQPASRPATRPGDSGAAPARDTARPSRGAAARIPWIPFVASASSR